MLDLKLLPKCQVCFTTRRYEDVCHGCEREKEENEIVDTLKKLCWAVRENGTRCQVCFGKILGSGKKYCDKCFLEGKNFNGLDFVREKIRARDKFTCRLCKRVWKKGERRFDVHHLNIELGRERSYRIDKTVSDDMVTLCHHCHTSEIHPAMRDGASVDEIRRMLLKGK